MRSASWFWQFGLIAIVVLWSVADTVLADDAPTQPAAEEAQTPAEPVAEKVDPFKVPDGTPAELLSYLAGLSQLRPEAPTGEVMEAFRKKLFDAVIEATDKVLAAKPDEKQVQQAIEMRLGALMGMLQQGDAKAEKQLRDLPVQLNKLGYQEMGRAVEGLVLRVDLQQAIQGEPEDLAKVIERIKAYVGTGKIGRTEFSLMTRTTQTLEMTGDNKMAATAYRDFGKILAANEDPRVADLGKRMEGAARRMELVGKPMKLWGDLLDGKPLDWKTYRGKVVAVQFWATWCQPCRAEITNLMAMYDEYHDRGFDVLGINCDDDREAVDTYLKENPLPWHNVFSTDSEATGMDNPLVNYYGVMGIPVVMLVDKQGKVVSLNARGENLKEDLAKLLGPAKTEEAASSE